MSVAGWRCCAQRESCRRLCRASRSAGPLNPSGVQSSSNITKQSMPPSRIGIFSGWTRPGLSQSRTFIGRAECKKARVDCQGGSTIDKPPRPRPQCLAILGIGFHPCPAPRTWVEQRARLTVYAIAQKTRRDGYSMPRKHRGHGDSRTSPGSVSPSQPAAMASGDVMLERI